MATRIFGPSSIKYQGCPHSECLGTSDSVELWFGRVLDSDTFRKAPTLRRLLAYLWEHRDEVINQYALGVDVLGRRPDFDPKSDAAVRVHIARLRQRLKEFYEAEPPGFPLHLSIPLGTTQLVSDSQTPVDSAPPVGVLRQDSRPHRSLVILLAVSCALLSAALGFMLINNTVSPRPPREHSVAGLSAFWKSFLGNGMPVSLVLPTPVCLLWEDRQIAVRDARLTQFDQWRERAAIRWLAKSWGAPKLSQEYTVTRDAFAVVRLLQYLERHGIQANVSTTPNIPVELPEANVVFLGVPGSTRHVAEHLSRANFHISVGAADRVCNRNPKPGEPAEYKEQRQSERRLIQPGIAAVIPGPSANTKLMLLAGRPMPALATFLTSSEGLKMVDSWLRKEGDPQYFEMVLLAEVDGDTVLRVWPEACRRVGNSLKTNRNMP